MTLYFFKKTLNLQVCKFERKILPVGKDFVCEYSLRIPKGKISKGRGIFFKRDILRAGHKCKSTCILGGCIILFVSP